MKQRFLVGAKAAVLGLALAVLGACTFEARGLGDFQFEVRAEDRGGLPDGSGVGDIESEDGSGDAVDARDFVPDVGKKCGSDLECRTDWECVTGTCTEGHCVFEAVDSLCKQVQTCAKFRCSFDWGCEPVLQAGADCEAPNKCFDKGTCSENGECVGVGEVPCEAKECYRPECDPEIGCVEIPDDGKKCDDGSTCTVDDACFGGECAGTKVPGLCPCKDDLDCAEFDDDDKCNGSMACIDGTCGPDPGTIVVCDPSGNPCVEKECDVSTGKCYDKPSSNEKVCDDENPCTYSTQCDGQGQCKGQSVADETQCDLDGDKCTVDLCWGGKCKLEGPKNCDTGSPCVEGYCDPATGGCGLNFLNGDPCDDGDKCTLDDTCEEGMCEPQQQGCAVCDDELNAGKLCDDGNPGTAADFCFGQACLGFKTDVWAAAPGLGAGFSRVTSLGPDFYLTGVKKTNASTVPKFVKLSPGAGFVQEVPYTGTLSDIDGRVAVGPGGQLYYLGPTWSVGSSLQKAVEAACPGMKPPTATIEPSAVAYLDSPGTLPGFTAETVLVGFSQLKAGAGCFIVLCSRGQPSEPWTCKSAGFDQVPVFEDLAAGTLVSTTALRLPPKDAVCIAGSSCISAANPIYAGLSWEEQEGTVVAVVQGSTDKNGVLKLEMATKQTVPTTKPVVQRISSFAVDAELNVFAAGNHRLLYSKPAGQGGAFVPAEYAVLGQDETHFFGVYHDKSVTVVATTRSSVPDVPEAPQVRTFRVGTLTGTSGLLLSGAGTEEPFFGSLGTFSDCLDCYKSVVGPWGITDAALNHDHMASPTGAKPLLVLCGTVPQAGEATPVGAAFVLAPL